MSMFASFIGGLGLFLLGMWLMTEGLKVAAGDALRAILERWTKSQWRALISGAGLTAFVQSSSAVTVATVGFVNAGLLTLSQAIGVVYGANVGTTMTGWLIALIGLRIDVGALALPLLGIGMALRLIAGRAGNRLSGAGEALAGFGAFFMGVGVLNSTFTELAPNVSAFDTANVGIGLYLIFLLLGVVLTTLTQSSSAAIAIALTAGAGGAVPLQLAAATVVGTNLGTTSTALFASIGATPAAKRVASAHVIFNLLTGLIALLLLPLLVALSQVIVSLFTVQPDIAATLAIFHTFFNVIGVSVIWPLTPRLVQWLENQFTPAEDRAGRPKFLDPTLAAVPSVALRGIALEIARMDELATKLARERIEKPSDASGDQDRATAIQLLGQNVRSFVCQLNRSALSDEVVERIPDAIRAVQHIEEMTDFVLELPKHHYVPPVAFEAAWQNLKDRVHTCLNPRALPQADDAGFVPSVEHRLAAEEAYRTVKHELLRAAAVGELTVNDMEDWIQRAQLYRRIAVARFKTERRLFPLLITFAQLHTLERPGSPASA